MRRTIANALLDQADLLARQVTGDIIARRGQENQPDLWRRKCHEDTRYHLAYLAEAVRYDSSQLFLDYVGWAKILLHHLRIPGEAFDLHLQLLEEHAAKLLPPEAETYISPILRNARQALPSLPHQIPSFLQPDIPLASLAADWTRALLDRQPRRAREIILHAFHQGVPVPSLHDSVFTPALYEVGRLWQHSIISEAEEHFCAQTTETILAMLSTFIEPLRVRKAVVAFCAPNEVHQIGVRMVADCFLTHGWDAICLGANVPVSNMEKILKTWTPDVVAISATMTYHLPYLEEAIHALKTAPASHPPKVLVGGRPFNISPELGALVCPA